MSAAGLPLRLRARHRPLIRPFGPPSPTRGEGRRCLALDLQHLDERFLRNLYLAELAHALLALFLLFEELALAGDVAAVAFGGHVLAHGGDGLAGDDLAADGRLDRDLEHVAGDQVLQLLAHEAAALFGRGAVDQHGERVDRLLVDEDRHLDEIALPVTGQLVVERGVALGDRLQPVVEIEHDLVERQFIGDHGAAADIGEVGLDAAALLA